eukprot:TRINITY_DN4898_c0_g2_i2.p1 TRINITY_DN4898_c0_g2~~TRINITY_DN4898_c0_g2_i2.p1  ORF type:complete len:241 (+),score=15.82 TRINITY_DN4898_c0_g2_i2:227-949(+)
MPRAPTSTRPVGAPSVARVRKQATFVPQASKSIIDGPLPDNPLDRPAPGEPGIKLPNQGQSVVQGTSTPEVAVLDQEKPSADIDYLQELLAIQENGPKNIAFFGTRNMGFLHQQLIEILSYAMVITGNHIYTSGGSGTNAAVVRGALRAEKPELLTVILPQSLEKQPPEMQELLSQVERLHCLSHNDNLTLLEASRVCNTKIISEVQQLICFAFHDSSVLLETCREARERKTIVTLCYLD